MLVSNPPFAEAMEIIEHAFALGFRVVILLLKANVPEHRRALRTAAPARPSTPRPRAGRAVTGHARRQPTSPKAARRGSQTQDHSWFVFDRNYCGPATINPVSINDPTARMPWAVAAPEAAAAITSHNVVALGDSLSPAIPAKHGGTLMTKKASMHVVSEEESNEAIAPVTVGNPLAAADLAIDQSHMEEFATDEEGPPDVTCAKPPKGTFFTVRAETSKPWRDREFYFLLELKDRDPYIVAPAHRQAEEGGRRDSPGADRPLRHHGRRGRPVGAQARPAGRQVQQLE